MGSDGTKYLRKTRTGGGGSTETVKNPFTEDIIKTASARLTKLQGTIDDAGGDPNAAEDAVTQEFTFTNPNIPTDASKAGEPGYDDKGNRLLEGGQNAVEQTITVREGDGMVDLLGDRREIVDYQTRHCLLYTSPSPRDGLLSRMPSSA